MAIFDEMNKTVKKFFEHLDTMLENDKDISINSTDELLREYDKHTSKISK
jgi:hypothetical protein